MDYQTSFKGIQPMIWETDERKRNTNNVCSFSVPEDITLKKGDRITAPSDKDSISVREITEVVENRPSLMTGRNYVTVKTKWYKEKIK